MKIDDVIYSSPEGEFDYPEYLVLAATFEEEDFDEIGVPRSSVEFDDLYLGKNEFENFKNKLKDYSFWREFYDNHKLQLGLPYWQGVTKNRFVEDVIHYAPGMLEDFRECCERHGLYDHFEPLDKDDDRIRILNEKASTHKILKLKSKYGYVFNKLAFRLYAVEIDTNCFIITGGTIKISRKMQEATNTSLELKKLNYLVESFNSAGIHSMATYLDFIYQ